MQFIFVNSFKCNASFPPRNEQPLVFHAILQVFSTTFLTITLGVFFFLTCHSETIAFTGHNFNVLDNSEIFELKLCLFVEVINEIIQTQFYTLF